MSIQELEKDIRLLPREERNRLTAFLTCLRLEESSDTREDRTFVPWNRVREEFIAPEK